jgi:hypothetical protein
MWFEYEAKFTDGRLIEIRPISIYRNGARGLQDVFYPPPDRPAALETIHRHAREAVLEQR